MISVAEALDRLFALVPPPREEEVPLVRAHGRVLLHPVTARRSQPPFAASAMDGFALRRADASPGARLRIVGASAAGHRFMGRINPGEATRILTGAPLPDGADAVVIQEEVTREGDSIVLSPTAVAAHVRPEGNDFVEGATLDAPRLLSPMDLALIASFGQASAVVARRPEVAILSTGDELVMPGGTPGPDQIFAANAFGLHALLRGAGARPRLLPVAGDTPGALMQALALAGNADIIVTIGGASVGDHDLIAPVVTGMGASLDFHRVAMRPGKPLLAGRMPHGAVLLGLPGNPVSALVCGVIFLLPVIRAMQGLPALPAPRVQRPLARPLAAGGPREHYLRARHCQDGSVDVLDRQDSSLLTVLAQADSLVVQGAEARPLQAGDIADVVLLRGTT